MAGNKQAFLFVNKDWQSPSLTKTSAKEQTNINSHVQRGRRHHRNPASSRRKEASKDQTAPSLKQSESSGSSESPPESSSSALAVRTSPRLRFTSIKREESTGQDDESGALRIRTAQQTSDDLVNIASPFNDIDRGHRTTGGLLTPDLSPADIAQFTTSLDPFDNSSIHLDAKTHSLINYYKDVYHPAVWHVETRASSKGEYAFQTTSADVIRSALSSDVDMFALLACMASRLEYVDKVPGYSTDEYLGKALSATRKFIAKRASLGPKSHEEILMVIFHLYAAEGYRNNVAAAKIHMKGAKTIVTAIGGLNKLRDPQMQELLIIGDGLLSAMTLQPCELPSAESDHPPALQNLLDQVAELNWVLMHAKNGNPDASKHAMRWIQMRSMAIRHGLLQFNISDPRLDSFRGSVVLWIVTTTTLLGLKRLALVIAPQIRAKLQAAEQQSLRYSHRDINAWILSLGAMSAMPGSPDTAWFVSRLANLLDARRIVAHAAVRGDGESTLLKMLRDLQTAFFFHEAVHGGYLVALAKNLMREATT
ncbi:uncharacterized protein AB675_7745 [Cyphellophora attinorum]|uniref:Tachykinin family protein n=1 Tax=Cyphellophora attinorum TaxID=1664694 RepID=A0A0N1HUG8_9EURO|nr:uncharacterized protein AB675_7745 [Phialophora attinorum]KPI40574.1 hypothetical protein AB675_7745 [Phialophora attinorum]